MQGPEFGSGGNFSEGETKRPDNIIEWAKQQGYDDESARFVDEGSLEIWRTNPANEPNMDKLSFTMTFARWFKSFYNRNRDKFGNVVTALDEYIRLASHGQQFSLTSELREELEQEIEFQQHGGGRR